MRAVSVRNPVVLGALTVGAVSLALFEGYANLHSDDSGVLAGSLFLFSAVYGALMGPRWAWVAAGFLAASVPVSSLLSVALSLRVPYGGQPTAPAVILPLLFALAGAYAGAGMRSLARA